MGLSKNLGQYADIKPILDAALATNGGRYELGSPNQAVRWRQRAYQMRKLIRQRMIDQNPFQGYEPSTPYDSMKITIDGSACVIDFYKPQGKWVPNEGGPYVDPFVQAQREADDDLTRAAKDFAASLMRKEE